MSMGLLVSRKSDFDADFELSRIFPISDFRFTKNGQRLNLIAGFQMLHFFKGMRVFCLKYPFSHNTGSVGKTPNLGDLPIFY